MIKTFCENHMGQNIYLYFDEKSGEGVLIDAGCSERDKQTIKSTISETNITIKAILLTHGHYDHIIMADEMKTITGANIYCHEAEKQVLENPNVNLSIHTINNIIVNADNFFQDDDVFSFGDITLKVLHTPGHTLGGVCYLDEHNGILFTGDTLFKNSIGRTDFIQGSFPLLIENIKSKLLTLPEKTIVYPGHGQSTTIGDEKKDNQFLS